jgi:XTP/dITP diphosphohydrolase
VRVLLATTNRGKLIELEEIMSDLGIEVTGLRDPAGTQGIETGSTFAENALLKARYYHRLYGVPTIADDSGLEVEALGGRPGIHSARYAGPGASDADRVRRLLNEMKGLPPPRRGARFVCAAALVWQDGEKVFRDEATGVILENPRGANGFGYDPVFFYEPLAKTFAELTPSEKAAVSHRGRAFRKLAAWASEPGALDTRGSGDKIVATADKTFASSTEV